MLLELCHATLVYSHKMHQTVLTEVVSPNVIKGFKYIAINTDLQETFIAEWQLSSMFYMQLIAVKSADGCDDTRYLDRM